MSPFDAALTALAVEGKLPVMIGWRTGRHRSAERAKPT